MANSKARYKKSLSVKSKQSKEVQKKIKQRVKERDQKLREKEFSSDDEPEVIDFTSNFKSNRVEKGERIGADLDFGEEPDKDVLEEYFGEDFLNELSSRAKRQLSGEGHMDAELNPVVHEPKEFLDKFGAPQYADSDDEKDDVPEDDEDEEDDEENEDDEEEEKKAPEGEHVEDRISALERFKQQLEQARSDDPEIAEYLDEAEVDDAIHAINEDIARLKVESKKILLTQEFIDASLEEAHSALSVNQLKKVLFFFKFLCRADPGNARDAPFVFDDPKKTPNYIALMTEELCELFNLHLGRDPTDTRLPNTTSRWLKYKNLCLSFVSNLLHYLQKADQKAELLKSVDMAVPFFGNFPIKAKQFLRVCLDLIHSDQEMVRFRGFIMIRKMAVMFPYPFISFCLKGIYLTYSQYCKPFNVRTYDKVVFLMNCVREVYCINFDSAYQHAYVYLRVMAMTLRQAIEQLKTGKKAKSEVLKSWRYLQQLRVWTKVIGSNAKEEELGHLVYPLSQVLIALINFGSRVSSIPLKLHTIALLNELSQLSGFFIPVLNHILEILSSPKISATPRGSVSRAVNLDFMISADKKLMDRREPKDAVIKECLDLLVEHLAINSNSVAFPELADPIIKALRKLKKQNTYVAQQYAKRIAQIVASAESNIQFIYGKRANLGLAPKAIDKTGILCPVEETPLNTVYKQIRTQRQERIKMLFSTSRPTKRPALTDEDLVVDKSVELQERQEKQMRGRRGPGPQGNSRGMKRKAPFPSKGGRPAKKQRTK